MRRLFPVAIMASLSPAMAQDLAPPNLATSGQGTQGGVARLYLSHQLYTLGFAAKDPLTVLNAARLAASVTLTDATTSRESSQEITPATPWHPITPAEMFDTAATLSAENETLLDLIDTNRREANYTPATVAISSSSTISPAATQTWPKPFYGDSLAEVAILGNGDSNLDLKITDENGNLVCQDRGPADIAYCSFYPAQNGTFLITVNNNGLAANSYLSLTN